MDVVGPPCLIPRTPLSEIDMREFCDRSQCNVSLVALKQDAMQL
jgi:hypothetical protein